MICQKGIRPIKSKTRNPPLWIRLSKGRKDGEYLMFLMSIIVFDLIIALCMFLIGFYFYSSKGKAADYLTGYNIRSEDQRKKVNEDLMCQCYGKRMMFMALPFLWGMILDFFKPGLGNGLAWIVWFILFVLLLIKRAKLEK